MSDKKAEVFLGDGLYARDDGYTVQLRAPKDGGDHYISLDADTLSSLIAFIEKSRNLIITIKQKGVLE